MSANGTLDSPRAGNQPAPRRAVSQPVGRSTRSPAEFSRRSMKSFLVPLIIIAALGSGCFATGPAVSKGTMGNLEVSVIAPQGMDTRAVRLHVDGVFVGNVSERLPVLYLKRGRHAVRVELEGARAYEQAIEILGEPNHQVLNVILEKR